MKASELFLRAASKLGIENIFGIVGGEAQAIQFDEVKDINFYLTRHEFAAGIMADVAARVSGKPQMCYSTFGPGLTNLSTGVFSAIQDRSPVLAVSAQINRSEICYNQTHQCMDNVKFMSTITKYATQLETVDEIPSTVKKAIEIALDGIPGPAYISFPLDLMEQEISEEKALKLLDGLSLDEPRQPPTPDLSQLNQIAKKIADAKHPMVVVGNQVIRENCCEIFQEFIEKTGLPVLSTLASKGVISEDHPRFISAGNKYIDKLYQGDFISKIFASCDLMLLIGYDFGEDLKSSFWGKDKIESIVINSFYNDMGSVFQPTELYTGDMKASLEHLLQSNIPLKQMPAELETVRQVLTKRDIPEETTATVSVSSIMKSIRAALGKDGILCSDIGLHKQFAGLLTKTYEPNTFLCSNVCGTFGFGFPAALGAKLASPTKRVCVICGDGGFHSTSQDLETAVRYNIPVVIVMLKDNAFGLIKYYQLLGRKDIFEQSVGFGEVDFVKLAEANGMQGVQMKDPSDLKSVMDQAFESGQSLLVEIPLKYRYDLIANGIAAAKDKETELA